MSSRKLIIQDARGRFFTPIARSIYLGHQNILHPIARRNTQDNGGQYPTSVFVSGNHPFNAVSVSNFEARIAVPVSTRILICATYVTQCVVIYRHTRRARTQYVNLATKMLINRVANCNAAAVPTMAVRGVGHTNHDITRIHALNVLITDRGLLSPAVEIGISTVLNVAVSRSNHKGSLTIIVCRREAMGSFVATVPVRVNGTMIIMALARPQTSKVIIPAPACNRFVYLKVRVMYGRLVAHMSATSRGGAKLTSIRVENTGRGLVNAVSMAIPPDYVRVYFSQVRSPRERFRGLIIVGLSNHSFRVCRRLVSYANMDLVHEVQCLVTVILQLISSSFFVAILITSSATINDARSGFHLPITVPIMYHGVNLRVPKAGRVKACVSHPRLHAIRLVNLGAHGDAIVKCFGRSLIRVRAFRSSFRLSIAIRVNDHNVVRMMLVHRLYAAAKVSFPRKGKRVLLSPCHGEDADFLLRPTRRNFRHMDKDNHSINVRVVKRLRELFVSRLSIAVGIVLHIMMLHSIGTPANRRAFAYFSYRRPTIGNFRLSLNVT